MQPCCFSCTAALIVFYYSLFIVNTAARMETNGVKGRIHVSQATADALITSGKGSLLTEREGGITAKGKGAMKSYFIQQIGGTATNKSGNTSDTGHVTIPTGE